MIEIKTWQMKLLFSTGKIDEGLKLTKERNILAKKLFGLKDERYCPVVFETIEVLLGNNIIEEAMILMN